MKRNIPTDLDPSAGIIRPDQVPAALPERMPTLADLGVRTRSAGASATTAAASGKQKGK